MNRCAVKLGVKISQDIVWDGNVDVPSAVPLSGELKDWERLSESPSGASAKNTFRYSLYIYIIYNYNIII